MEEKIAQIKKAIKGDCIFLNLLVSVMIILAFLQVVEIVKLSKINAEDFEVRLVQEESGKSYYNLFYGDGKSEEIDYNAYMTNVDEEGNTNFKMCLVIEKVGKIVEYICFAIIFYFANSLVEDLFLPFSKKNINRLRIIAVTTIVAGVLPLHIMSGIRLIIFQETVIDFLQINYPVILLGVILGVISEIFRYGNILQEEIDQIC